jgi:transcriptional regulator with XRE-family HTH domain
MPRTPLKPSLSLAHLLKTRRTELGFSLREVARQSASLGESIPFPTLRKIEEGLQEPGVRRLYVLCELYDVPLELIPDLLELDRIAAPVPRSQNIDRLYERGLAHWKRGELGRALGYLFALRIAASRQGVDRVTRHKAMLSFAIAACGLGRTKLAHRVVEQIILETPDDSIAFETFYQAGVTWVRLGSPRAAAGFLHSAAELVTPGNARQSGLLNHQLAKVAILQSQYDKASTLIRAAMRDYRRAKDAWNLLIVRRLAVRLLLAEAKAGDALRAAKALRRECERVQAAQLGAYARLDEGCALLRLDRPQPALEALADAYQQALALKDLAAQFYVHFWMWKSHLRLGDQPAAAVELGHARLCLRHVDEVTVETVELNAHPGGENGHDRQRQGNQANRR